jgi:hypothetical protein
MAHYRSGRGPRWLSPHVLCTHRHSLVARVALVVPWADTADAAVGPRAGVGVAYISEAVSVVYAASYPRMLLGQCRAGNEADPDNEAANECAHLDSPNDVVPVRSQVRSMTETFSHMLWATVSVNDRTVQSQKSECRWANDDLLINNVIYSCILGWRCCRSCWIRPKRSRLALVE